MLDYNGIPTNMYMTSRLIPNEAFMINITMMNTKDINKKQTNNQTVSIKEDSSVQNDDDQYEKNQFHPFRFLLAK